MAVDMFLKLTDIPGESKDSVHADSIDILSWSWGESQQGTFAGGGGGGAGKVNMQNFNFTQRTQKSSPELFLRCASGKHIPEALVTARKAGDDPKEYMKIKFTDCMITSFQTGGSAGGDEIIESISIDFAKVEFAYDEQKADGSMNGFVTKWYDTKTNTKG